MTINGTSIHMIRGDSESITVTVEGYQLQAGDIAELTLRRSVRSGKVLHKTTISYLFLSYMRHYFVLIVPHHCI